MKIADLQIDFPEIEGYSNKQIWYAERLVESYVMANYERFSEIERLVNLECDNRIGADGGDYKEDYKDYTFCEVLSDGEKACLFCDDAGGIIGTLKRIREEHPECFEY